MEWSWRFLMPGTGVKDEPAGHGPLRVDDGPGTKLGGQDDLHAASDGSVTQRCERSVDGGRTWAIDCC